MFCIFLQIVGPDHLVVCKLWLWIIFLLNLRYSRTIIRRLSSQRISLQELFKMTHSLFAQSCSSSGVLHFCCLHWYKGGPPRRQTLGRGSPRFGNCLAPSTTSDATSAEKATPMMCLAMSRHRTIIESRPIAFGGKQNSTLEIVTRTWCQILCTMRLQCVSKILTPLRMLQKTWLIAKINLRANSSQNMYDMP